MRTFPATATNSDTREAAATRGDRQTPMKPGDQIVIDGKLHATIRAIRSREQLQEIAPLLSEALDMRLSSQEVIRAAIIATRGKVSVIIETAAGWQTAAGTFITVQLLSEARPC